MWVVGHRLVSRRQHRSKTGWLSETGRTGCTPRPPADCAALSVHTAPLFTTVPWPHAFCPAACRRYSPNIANTRAHPWALRRRLTPTSPCSIRSVARRARFGRQPSEHLVRTTALAFTKAKWKVSRMHVVLCYRLSVLSSNSHYASGSRLAVQEWTAEHAAEVVFAIAAQGKCVLP